MFPVDKNVALFENSSSNLLELPCSCLACQTRMVEAVRFETLSQTKIPPLRVQSQIRNHPRYNDMCRIFVCSLFFFFLTKMTSIDFEVVVYVIMQDSFNTYGNHTICSIDGNTEKHSMDLLVETGNMTKTKQSPSKPYPLIGYEFYVIRGYDDNRPHVEG